MRKQQQGVALIMAVLIAALVTTAAIAMASRQQLDVRRTANILNSDQAFIAALAVEDFARDVLVTGRTSGATDNNNNPTADHLNEPWATSRVLPFEDMTLAGQMEDMQGRFNLNNLLDANGDPAAPQVAVFKRLLINLKLDEDIADAVVDWLDADRNRQGFAGAEDTEYELKTPPYHAANNFMSSPSELLLIEGIDHEVFSKLRDYVTVLFRQKGASAPYQATAVNVNTASYELLMALHPQTDSVKVQQLIDDRKDPGNELTDPDAFWQLAGVNIPQNTPNNPIPTVDVNVISDYFVLNASADFDESRGQVFSLLKFVANDKVDVVMRGRGVY